MENPYSRAPLQVTLYDVTAGAPGRSYMLMGAVPRGVLAAAERGAPWSGADAATLRRHYGPRWRRLLTPQVEAAKASSTAAVGGADFGDELSEHLADFGELNELSASSAAGGAELADFGELDELSASSAAGGAELADFGDLADFDELGATELAEGARDGSPSALTMRPREGAPSRATPPDWDGRTVYCDTAAYPEDTFADLKGKIHVATGVPPYRQHLFYEHGPASSSEARAVRTTYRVTVQGALVLTDVRRLARGGGDTVAGIPVDRRLEELKNDVRVDALDAFRTLEETPGAYVRRVFVADLATLLRPRAALLQAALADAYQFDLLYYGVVLKYWPALSPEAFRLAAASPAELAAVFPLLDPPLGGARARFRAERALIDQVYSQTKAQTARRARAEALGGVAVTRAEVAVEPRASRTPVTLRNVLDWIPTTRSVPAVAARLRPDVRKRDYLVEKTHVSAAAPRVAAALESFRPPRRPGVTFAIIRAPREARPQFVYLTVRAGGQYTIRSSWREDDRVGFDEVVRQLSAAACPVIERINAMGAAALPLGGALETPAEASKGVGGRATIGSLTVSTFWPRALTTEGFRAMKARWRAYERAGIVGIRGLQEAGAYAFLFRKGVTDYDPRALERAGPPGGRQPAAAANHYAHLTDPVVAQRWRRAFAGRLVRIFHRTTDLRVETAGVSMAEFRRIQLYLFAFLDGLVRGRGRLARGVVRPGRARPTEGRLRSLQERDPDLFDLKKFDEGATVFSVLCQGARQPEMVSEREARALGPAARAALVPYWNFTRKRRTFYRCPSKRFPHLSFRAGEHPLGHCLPCCKKTRALPGSRAAAVNSLCLRKRRVSEEDELGGDPRAASRHVLAYGKALAAGRISRAPRLLSEGLFFDTLPRPYVYRLVGVAQRAPGLPGAGYFYALAAALSLEPEELARELAGAAVALRETFRSLAGGSAAAFASAEDLADALVTSFLPREAPGFSPFGPGGAAAASWRGLVAELVRVRFDVDVVVFADPLGDGEVELTATAAVAARLRASADGAPLDLAVLVAGPAGTYPLVAMAQKAFLRRPLGRGPARRFFSSAYGEGVVADGVVGALRGLALSEAPAGCGAEPRAFDLGFVSELCVAEGFRVLFRLINLRDMCYGVVLELPEGRAYFPVPYSPHFLPPRSPPGGPPAPTALYGPRPPGAYPPRALARVLEAANAKAGQPPAPRLRPAARLVSGGGAVVGFIAEVVCGAAPTARAAGRAFFHHDPVPAARAGALPWGGAPEAAAPYDMADVDRAIYDAGGAPQLPPLPADKVALAVEGLFRHRLYRFFVAEFAALLQGERNARVRAALEALFARTRFSSPGSLAAFRAGLAELLPAFPEDVAAIRSLVASLYARVGPAALLAALREAFAADAFDFDRTTLARLRALDGRDAVEAELARLMRARVALVAAEGAPPRAPRSGIFVACSLPSDVDRPQCAEAEGRGAARRLRMPAGRFEAYVSILAADVRNPLKAATLATLTAGVAGGARFVAHPGETIRVRR